MHVEPVYQIEIRHFFTAEEAVGDKHLLSSATDQTAQEGARAGDIVNPSLIVLPRLAGHATAFYALEVACVCINRRRLVADHALEWRSKLPNFVDCDLGVFFLAVPRM